MNKSRVNRVDPCKTLQEIKNNLSGIIKKNAKPPVLPLTEYFDVTHLRDTNEEVTGRITLTSDMGSCAVD